MDFFSSEIGVAIAWFCTVAGFIFGSIKSNQNKRLKVELSKHENANQAMQNEIGILKAKVVDLSNNVLNQTGEKNIYTKQNSGGMKINM